MVTYVDKNSFRLKVDSKRWINCSNNGSQPYILYSGRNILCLYCTANGLQKIEINSIIKGLFNDVDLISIFNTIIESSGNATNVNNKLIY